MADCLVIGGGFAGLSAAAYLSEYGFNTELWEASPKLGGRAYSFHIDELNDTVDNGQHILMGCYQNTLDFLSLINANDKINIQKNLNVAFVNNKGKEFNLNGDRFSYPFNLLYGLINFRAVGIRTRLGIIKLFLKIYSADPNKYSGISTKEFLYKNNQSAEAIVSFWEIIHVGTLNCNLDESSAAAFIQILKIMFFTGNDSTKIILPKTGLSEMYCDPSVEFIKEKGGSVHLSKEVVSLAYDDKSGKVISVNTRDKSYDNFNYIVLAVSPFRAEKLLKESGIKINFPHLEYSPILTCHIWLNENNFEKQFYGLINSDIHWLFNHGKHITLVTSAAKNVMNIPKNELIEGIAIELKNYFPHFKKNQIRDYRIIKEKRATFISDKNVINSRYNINSYYGNLFLAGDWSNTGLPSTIEGAVKSGKFAAQKIRKSAAH